MRLLPNAWFIVTCVVAFVCSRLAHHFDDLQFDVPPSQEIDNDALPDRITRLNGTKVRLRGFMFGPSMPQPAESKFVLVRDNQAFFPWPISSNVVVQMRDQRKIAFTHRPVTVTGRFRVVELQRNGKLDYIYEIVAEKVDK